MCCRIILLTLWNLSKHTNSRSYFRFIRILCRLKRRRLIRRRLIRRWLIRRRLIRSWLVRSWLIRSWLVRSWLVRSWLVRLKRRCLHIWWGQRVNWLTWTSRIVWSWLVVIVYRSWERIFKSVGGIQIVNFLNIEISSVIISIKLGLALNCIFVFFINIG